MLRILSPGEYFIILIKRKACSRLVHLVDVNFRPSSERNTLFNQSHQCSYGRSFRRYDIMLKSKVQPIITRRYQNNLVSPLATLECVNQSN